MKICNQCQAALEDELEICPTCGASVTDVEPVAEEALEIPAEEPVEEVQEAPAEEPAEESVEEPVEESVEEPAPKKKRTGLIVGLALAAVVLVGVILVKGGKSAEEVPAEPGATVETPVEAPEQDAQDAILGVPGLHNNAYGYGSYSIHYTTAEDGTVSYDHMNQQGQLETLAPEAVEAKMQEVVATCGNMSLTNQELAYYYEQEYYTLYSTYSTYLPYFMDTAKAFDEQLCMDQERTWQQYLVDCAVDKFLQVAALCQTAEAEGLTLTEKELAELEANSDFDSIAAGYGLSSGEELMRMQFGPGASVEGYLEFYKRNMLATNYANIIFSGITVTDEEAEAYFDANAEMMDTNYNIQKIDKNMVNVRHILVQPAAAEDGSVSEEAWAAAEAEAQRIYDEWLAGAATEDTFAELAGTYTQDPGSKSTGGLYENVYPGQMVPAFNDWCFADGRVAGDHGIVKTNYGYHIMFFSSEGEYAYWEVTAKDLCHQEKTMARILEITEGFSPVVEKANAVKMDATAPSVPAVEEEAAAE